MACSECQKKDADLKEKGAALEKLQERIKQMEEFPSLVDMVRHCESGQCAAHSQEWQAIKSEIAKAARANVSPEELSHLSRTQVRELARKHGDWPPPNIAIPGLSTRARE